MSHITVGASPSISAVGNGSHGSNRSCSQPSTSESVTTADQRSLPLINLQRLRATGQMIFRMFLQGNQVDNDGEDVSLRRKQIEDYRPGYPQFSSLISAHNPYHMCRRFTQIRARLLLLKQDRLSMLEEQLEYIDNSEEHPIFLGNARRDLNPARKQILADMEIELREYDELIERNSRVLSYQAPRRGDVKSLENWVENSSSIATDETAYLSKPDLLCAASPSDDPLVQVELLLEKAVIFCYRLLKKHPQFDLSRDPNVLIFSSTLLKRITRGFIAWVVVLALLVPVIAISAVERVAIRLSIIVVASAVVIMMLALITKIKTWEMFLGGATYATVLVVFVPGSSAVVI